VRYEIKVGNHSATNATTRVWYGKTMEGGKEEEEEGGEGGGGSRRRRK
jgi:hypothetical protein